MTDSCHVYFVQAGDEFGPVKIGITNNIKKRLEMLQTGSPVKLRCLSLIDFESEPRAREAESSLHEMFDDLRLEGEWFEWHDDFVDLLKGFIQIPKLRSCSPCQSWTCSGRRITRLSFDMVRLAEGGVRFIPRTQETFDAVAREHPELRWK